MQQCFSIDQFIDVSNCYLVDIEDHMFQLQMLVRNQALLSTYTEVNVSR